MGPQRTEWGNTEIQDLFFKSDRGGTPQKSHRCIEYVQNTVLTFAKMRVDAHVSRCARQALVLPVRDVFFGLRVNVFFGQTKVYDVDCVLPLAAWPPNQKVLRFDIAVYQALGVDILHPCYLGNRQV